MAKPGVYKPRYGLTGQQVSCLYEMWRRNCLQDHGGWESFDAFLKWSAENGWRRNSILRRVRRSRPFSPVNCYWEHAQADGMEYPPESPCSACESNQICNHACEARRKYWDESMKKLRTAMTGTA